MFGLSKTIILTLCIKTYVLNNKSVNIRDQLIIEIVENNHRRQNILSNYQYAYSARLKIKNLSRRDRNIKDVSNFGSFGLD